MPCIDRIEGARFVEPTGRYPHGVLGDDLEWAGMRLDTRACGAGGGRLTVRLPEALVFEDVAPRLVDLDGQGAREVVVVESHQSRGARLAVWGLRAGALRRAAATPFIGTRFRWLAPVGAADLDGDGAVELAYVDRPHLARTLRIWRFVAGEDALVPLASLPGVSNHRIGERDIAGGMRDCGAGPEMILADAAWQRVLAVRFDGSGVTRRVLGPHRGRGSFAAALACRVLH
ncbi:MAG: VCBS repeat-containing protein [Rhodobacteraceae bacterium]|nr:MAG: VCBS repeat-containing protein [Paracoccaceae bacterium]